jgi:hypothetical protein
MGRAFILVNDEILARLRTDPILIDEIGIHGDPIDYGDGTHLVDVSSPLLPVHCEKQQCLILEPLGFKPDRDT